MGERPFVRQIDKSRSARLLFSGCWIGLYCTVIFAGLLIIYLPSFDNPPHGDYWEAFYSFKQYRSAPAIGRLLLIVNHDPWQDGTFRPFSYLFLYLAHSLFGSEFVWYGILNFLLYCLSVFLIYRLAVGLKLRRMVSALLIGVYIFLFTHSGILTLTFHQFVIAGFSAMLGGFVLYLRWREQEKKRFLVLAGLLFLLGMFCYESFIFWPPAVIFLHYLSPIQGVERSKGVKSAGYPSVTGLLIAVYLVYLVVFRLTRMAEIATGPLPDFTPGQVGLSLAAAFFNLSFTGIILNIFPFLSLPCSFRSWVEMGGVIREIPDHIFPAVIIAAGVVTILSLAFGFRRLSRRRSRETRLQLGFLLYLYVSNFSLLFLARIPLGDLHHILVQFRYQYIPNALLILMLAVLLGPYLTRRRAGIVGGLLFLIMVANITVSQQTVTAVNQHLAPLKRVLNRVQAGIDSGEINPQERILIQQGITSYLPRLSWQSGIGQRMRGSYEWVFYPRFGDRFTRSRGEAAWILDSPLGVYRRNENAGE